eukprot:m.13765 g.13765  ORF g.13765 m.13765 type:complete len:209 (+) comp4651_c1_seq1:200-826(+)
MATNTEAADSTDHPAAADGCTEHPPSNDASTMFECNICLDTASEPVVTKCGHLYCWPCLHEWLERSKTCPVCKSCVTADAVIPLYSRGSTKQQDPRTKVPPRPRGTREEPPPEPFGARFFNGGFGGGVGGAGANVSTFFGLPGLFGVQFGYSGNLGGGGEGLNMNMDMGMGPGVGTQGLTEDELLARRGAQTFYAIAAAFLAIFMLYG